MADSLPSRPLLEKFRVGTLPSVYVVPDYVDEETEKRLLENVGTFCFCPIKCVSV